MQLLFIYLKNYPFFDIKPCIIEIIISYIFLLQQDLNGVIYFNNTICVYICIYYLFTYVYIV